MNLENLTHLYAADLEISEILKMYDSDPKVFGFRVAEKMYLEDSGGDRGMSNAKVVAKAFGLEIDIVAVLYKRHYEEAELKFAADVAEATVIENNDDEDSYKIGIRLFGDDFFGIDYFYDAESKVEYDVIKGARNSVLGKVVA